MFFAFRYFLLIVKKIAVFTNEVNLGINLHMYVWDKVSIFFNFVIER